MTGDQFPQELVDEGVALFRGGPPSSRRGKDRWSWQVSDLFTRVVPQPNSPAAYRRALLTRFGLIVGADPAMFEVVGRRCRADNMFLTALGWPVEQRRPELSYNAHLTLRGSPTRFIDIDQGAEPRPETRLRTRPKREATRQSLDAAELLDRLRDEPWLLPAMRGHVKSRRDHKIVEMLAKLAAADELAERKVNAKVARAEKRAAEAKRAAAEALRDHADDAWLKTSMEQIGKTLPACSLVQSRLDPDRRVDQWSMDRMRPSIDLCFTVADELTKTAVRLARWNGRIGQQVMERAINVTGFEVVPQRALPANTGEMPVTVVDTGVPLIYQLSTSTAGSLVVDGLIGLMTRR